MIDVSMTNPIEKLKKVSSLDEVFTRGGQALSAYREQRKGGAAVPSDADLARLIDQTQFGSTPIIPETLWSKFYTNGAEKFFPTFRDTEGASTQFRKTFAASANKFIALAENLCDGRIDLLGLRNLYVGSEIDWHRDPLSSKRSPLKHWKKFDDLDSTETGNKKVTWELNRHQHFFTLGVAYWLTRDEKYASLYASHLDSWMRDNPPGMGVNWASSLEVGFRSISWIWAFQFFKESDSLTPALFHRALKYLYLHGKHIEKYLSTYYSPNTHLTGEALALYYLGTQLPFFERSARWRKLGEDILFSEISKQVLSDGVYFEQSTWYQRYTAEFFIHFVVLRSLWGEDRTDRAGLRLEGRLEQSFDFLMHATMPDGSTPLIGDDDGGRMLPLTGAAPDNFRGTLALSAVRFDRGDHKLVSGRVSEELFWLMGPDAIRSYEALEAIEPAVGSADFAYGGYCIMRDGWEATDNVMVVDCGEVGSLAGGHGHADVLSIEVAVRGRSLLVDSGTYTYHETRELRDYFRSTRAHNTLEVDGVPSSEPATAFSWKSRASSKREEWISTERFDYFSGSHDGYERLDDPVLHRRSILFVKNDYWIIRDMAEAKGEHNYSLNFHFDSNIRTSIGHNGKWVGGDDHRLYTFGDNGTWQAKESWISKNHGSRLNAPFIRFVSTGIGTQEFFSFLLPVDAGLDPPMVEEVPMVAGRAFVIRYAGYKDVFVVNDEPGQVVENGIFDSDFKYSWARLSDDAAVPEEFILIDGTILTIEGNRVLHGKALSDVAIRRFGKDLYIKSGSDTSTFELRFVDRRKADRRRPDSDRRQSDQ